MANITDKSGQVIATTQQLSQDRTVLSDKYGQKLGHTFGGKAFDKNGNCIGSANALMTLVPSGK